MKCAVVGSRGLMGENLGEYLPEGVSELVSGGARGVDTCAKEWAQAHGLPCREFLPDYARFGKAAPLRRNREIAAYADEILAFWDGTSRGTAHLIREARRLGKPVRVIRLW